MSNSYYRPDIDGLRALAVLSVLLFHLGFEFTSGGFVGVDVFFVISGFLITRLIRTEVLSTGKFSFSYFYIRRIRRLFPALFVTICLTSVCSVLLFSPSHLEKFGASLICALTSISNFFFWIQADYFDTAAHFKPLLHSWSLGVEEQFYLLWPLALVLMLKNGRRLLVPIILSCTVVISLYLNHVFADGQVGIVTKLSMSAAQLISDGKATIFYLLPFRAYELAIGGLMVFIANYQVSNRVLHEIILWLGLSMIIFSVLTFTEDILFPSYRALIPCVGTALMIYSGEQAKFLGKLFSNEISVGIGLISYSLYLIHWPIIVFWKYWTFRDISKLEGLIIIVVSVLLATIMYKYVEQPFRTKRGIEARGQKRAGLAALLACAMLLVMSGDIWKSSGWKWRINEVIPEELIAPEIPVTYLNNLANETAWTKACQFGNRDEDSVKILVLGDSHADQLVGGAKYLSSKYNLFFTFYTFTGCPPIFGTYKVYGAPSAINNESLKQKECREQTKIWEHYVLNNHFDYVILSSRWNGLFEPREYYGTRQRRDLLIDKKNPRFTVHDSKRVFSSFLDYTVRTIHASGARAIIFGQVPHGGKPLEGCNNIPTVLFGFQKINDRCNYVPRSYVLERSRFSNEVIKQVASTNNAIYVLSTDLFCSENIDFCQNVYKGIRLRNDDNHINTYGSVYLMREWEETDSFPFK